MHKKAIAIALLAASVAAVATTSPPAKVTRLSPTELHAMATQSAGIAQAPVRIQPQPVQYQPQAQARAYPGYAGAASALSRWRSLRQSDGHSFGAYASFLTSHRGWPGEAAMRQSAERAINDGSLANEVISYFRILPPTS
ncbi:MAG TPA: hypothetical protein VF582_04425, partial [Allosphingosinicella sp.]